MVDLLSDTDGGAKRIMHARDFFRASVIRLPPVAVFGAWTMPFSLSPFRLCAAAREESCA
jgi:hypothetical protein